MLCGYILRVTSYCFYMTYRQLTPEERVTTVRNLADRREELEAAQYLLKRTRLYLEEGFELEYRQKLKQEQAKLKNLEKDIIELRETINVTEEQLEKGVKTADTVETILDGDTQ